MSVRVNIEIGHEASIRTKRTQEGFTHDWEVFVRGADGAEIQYYIEKVVFNLHETFPKPKRVVKEPPYKVKESGYAGFNFPIDIYLRNKDEPKKIRFNYDLSLQPNGPAILNSQKEKFVFHNVNEEFKYKLLKGGGIIVSGSSNQLDAADGRNNSDDKPQLLNKPKLGGGADSLTMKKHKISKLEEQRPPSNSFNDLFGPPIKKTSKISPDPKTINKDLNKTNNNNKDKGSDSKDKIKNKTPTKDKDRDKDRSGKDSERTKTNKEREKLKDRTSSSSSNKERDRSANKLEQQQQQLSKRDKSPLIRRSISPKRIAAAAAAASPKRLLASPKRSQSPFTKQQQYDEKQRVDKERGATTTTTKTTTADDSQQQQQQQQSKKYKKEKRDVAYKETSGKDNLTKGGGGGGGGKDFKLKDFVKETIPKNDVASSKKEKTKDVANIVKEAAINKDIDVKLAGDEKKHKHKKRDKREKRNSDEKHKKVDKAAKYEGKEQLKDVVVVEKASLFNNSVQSTKVEEKMVNVVKASTKTTTSSSYFSDNENNSNSSLSSSANNKDDYVDMTMVETKSERFETPPPPPPLPPPPPSTKTASLENAAAASDKSKPKKEKTKKKDKKADKKEKKRKSENARNSTTQQQAANDEETLTKIARIDVADVGDAPSLQSTTAPPPIKDLDKENQENPEDYMKILKELQHKIMTLQDNTELQKVVQLIAETGRYEVSQRTFDFDLCLLERSTVKKLQEFFALST